MDVPDIMLYGTTLLSPVIPVTDVASDHDATISTPGAVKSGCTIEKSWMKWTKNRLEKVNRKELDEVEKNRLEKCKGDHETLYHLP